MLGNNYGLSSNKPKTISSLNSLLINGSKGFYFNANDLNNMFQNSNSTGNAAIGSPVGIIKNMFGGDKHAYQSVSASRPTLGRHPHIKKRNLLVFSSELASTPWVGGSGLTTFQNVGAVGVDGKKTASLLVENTDSNSARTRVQGGYVFAGKYYIMSIIGKSLGPQQRHLNLVFENGTSFGGNPNCSLNTITGAIAQSGGVETTTGAINLGNGWWKLWMRAKCVASGLNGFRVGFSGVDSSAWTPYTGDGVSGVAIDGVQVEIGKTVTDYQVIGDGKPVYNLLTHTEDFRQSPWDKRETTTPTPTRFVDSATGATFRRMMTGLPAGGYSLSFDFKRVGNLPGFTLLASDINVNGSVKINAITGQVVTGGTNLNISATTTVLSDGWIHVHANITYAATASYWDFRLSNVWPIPGNVGTVYTGDGTRGLDIRNIQMLAGRIEQPYQKVGNIYDVTQPLVLEPRRNLLNDTGYISTIPPLGNLFVATAIGPGQIFFDGNTTVSLEGVGDLGDGNRYIDLRIRSIGADYMGLNFTRGNLHIKTFLGQQFTMSFDISLIAGSLQNVSRFANQITEYSDNAYQLTVGSTFTPTATLTRYSYSTTVSDVDTNIIIPNLRMTFTGPVDYTIRVARPQLEFGSVATEYQRIYGQYDLSTRPLQPSNHYISFDAVDDFLATDIINWETDEVTVIASFKKRSDAAEGQLVSFGDLAVNGSFLVGAPGGGADHYLYAGTRGTNNHYVISTSPAYRSPTRAVMTYTAKISTNLNQLRVNAMLQASSTADLGNDVNYSNQKLLIGRRESGLHPAPMDLYSLFIINRILSPAEIALAEKLISDNMEFEI